MDSSSKRSREEWEVFHEESQKTDRYQIMLMAMCHRKQGNVLRNLEESDDRWSNAVVESEAKVRQK